MAEILCFRMYYNPNDRGTDGSQNGEFQAFDMADGLRRFH